MNEKEFLLSEKVFLLNEKEFLLSEKVFLLSKKVFLLSEKVFLLSEKVFLLSEKVFLLNEKVFLLSEKVFLLSEKVFLLSEKVFLLNEKVFLLNEKVFLLNEKVFLLNEKVFLLNEKESVLGEKEWLGGRFCCRPCEPVKDFDFDFDFKILTALKGWVGLARRRRAGCPPRAFARFYVLGFQTFGFQAIALHINLRAIANLFLLWNFRYYIILMPCLSCNDLRVSFSIQKRAARAVRGVSFELDDRKTLGIVGESGCGKSVTALSILRLLPAPPAKIESGAIDFEGRDLLAVPERQMREIRGRRISMIFQDPMTSLNPVFTCGNQVAETLLLHKGMSRKDAAGVCMELFSEVGIAEPARAYSSYPHHLSGGMRQRVMIAMALACAPRLLIADEPTTALDVTVQARLLELLNKLQAAKNMSMILITHNLGIVAGMAHNVIVMYAGEVMESAPSGELFAAPRHPYTDCLLKTVPSIEKRSERLTVIPGSVPAPLEIPDGCPFHPRCRRASERCRKEHPPLHNAGGDNGNHLVRCHIYE